MVGACIIAVVYLMRRGKARGASGSNQPLAAQTSGNHDDKVFVGYSRGGQVTTTETETSQVHELPVPGWQELSELPTDHHGLAELVASRDHA